MTYAPDLRMDPSDSLLCETGLYMVWLQTAHEFLRLPEEIMLHVANRKILADIIFEHV